MTQLFALAVFYFSIYLLSHVLFLRLIRPKGFLVPSSLSFVLFLILASPWLFKGGIESGLFTCFLLISAWNGLMVVLVISQNSVSLRIMDEVERSENRALSLTQLESCVPDESGAQSRIQLLVANRFLTAKGASFDLTGKGRGLARGALLIRRIFAISSGG